MKQTNQERLILIERVLLLKAVSIFSETPESILAEIAQLVIACTLFSKEM